MEDYEDSADRIREANYRKALALYTFMETYDSEGIYARLSMDPDKENRFSFSEAKADALGNSALDELRAACGQDEVVIELADTPAESFEPIGDCLTAVFRNLGDYKDSAARLDGLKELTNYKSAFFALCESGDLAAAAQWLNDYTGEFEQRDEWLANLSLYLPFCDDWGLYSGDPTVIPLTADLGGACMALRSNVSFKDGVAILHLYWSNEGEEYCVDLIAEPGDSNFYLQQDPFHYMAVISVTDHLAYMKYDGQATLWSSCEYSRIQ